MGKFPVGAWSNWYTKISLALIKKKCRNKRLSAYVTGVALDWWKIKLWLLMVGMGHDEKKSKLKVFKAHTLPYGTVEVPTAGTQ